MTSLDSHAPHVRWKVISFALGLSLVAVFLFLVSAAANLSPWLRSLFQELAGVLLISGVTTVLTEWLMRNDYLRELRLMEARILRSMIPEAQHRLQNLGLVDCTENANSFKYEQFISEAQELQICVNDGRTWISQHSSAISAHFLKEGNKLDFYVVAPDSPYLTILADKTEADPEQLKAKVRESTRLLIKCYSAVAGCRASLRIYWHGLPVVHSLYVSDKRALMSPYTISRPRATVPLLVFSNMDAGNYYRLIREDIARIGDDRDTRLVFEIQKGQVVRDEVQGGPSGAVGARSLGTTSV